ncbi:hypothetical protein BMS3Abin13_01527 [bacterium BMS3Abin13]|nr:hypothetical protein BMS3Abin13_01527 [bacterium BMS3Abin13]
MRQEIGFGNEKALGTEKGLGILGRFVRALGNRDQHDPFVLAQVKGGRTDQVADVFDKDQVKTVHAALMLQPVQTLMNQPGIEVTGPAGGDLNHRRPFFPDPGRITLGFDVPFNDPETQLVAEMLDGMFKQGGFAGPRPADHVDGDRPEGFERAPVFPGLPGVSRQQALIDVDCPGSLLLMINTATAGFAHFLLHFNLSQDKVVSIAYGQPA